MAEKEKKTAAPAGVPYTIEELAGAPEVFGVSADVVRAALSVAGKEEATKEEAMKIIVQFKTRRKE